MAAASEGSYGARLQNAQTLITLLSGLTHYKPTRTEDNLEDLNKLFQLCTEANNNVASATQNYTLSVKSRVDAFNGNQADSIKNLLSPISKAVQAQYGKDSREYTSIANIIAKMRTAKNAKASTTTDEAAKDKVSQSELSYNSLFQNFQNLVISLEQLQGFAPVHELIQKDSLKSVIERVGKYNQEVTIKGLALSQAREQRKTLFDELNIRSQRVKSYVSAAYSNKSSEYKAIVKLKI